MLYAIAQEGTMPHIVSPDRFKTKKAFREAVEADPSKVYVEDPSIFAPVSGTVASVLDSLEWFTVTNHPKRSWFAMVKRNGGKVKVT